MPAESSQTGVFPVLPGFWYLCCLKNEVAREAEQQPPLIIQM